MSGAAVASVPRSTTAPPEPSPRPAAGFRTDIQGLRAVAVLAVIADHVLHWPRGGFVGVDVFFVISGYLITGLLLREHERTGRVSFRGFYVRRVKRIVPVALVVLLATVAASYALLGRDAFRAVVLDTVASALFVGNWRFAVVGTDYFQQDIPPSPLQHFWSLAVEEQYYMVWPWLLLGLLLFGTRFLGWRREHARTVAGCAVAVITVASLAWALKETAEAPTWAYFSTFSRTWELGIGALVAVLAPWLRIPGIWGRTLLAWAGLAGIVVSCLTVSADNAFPAPWGLLPVLSAVAVIAAGEGGPTYDPVLRNRVSQYLGRISYSLYLWHWPIAVLLVTLLPERGGWYLAIALTLTLALSALSYRFVEEPARHANWFRRERRVATAPARFGGGVPAGWYRLAVFVVVLALAGQGARVAVDSMAPEQATAAPVVTAGQAVQDPANCFGAAAMDPAHDCPELNTGNSILPLPADAHADTGGSFGCYAAPGGTFTPCSYGSDKKDTVLRVAVTGDSHAASVLPMLKPQLKSLGWRLTMLVGRGCRLAPSEHASCAPHRAVFNERLTSGEFDVVVVQSRRGTGTSVEDYRTMMRKIVAAGTVVVALADNPTPDEPHMACLTSVTFSVSDGCATTRPAALAEADGPAEAAAGLDRGAAVVDLNEFYCDAASCPGVIGNVQVYRDTAGHLTGTWSATIGPYVATGIQEAYAEQRGSVRAAGKAGDVPQAR
ncbi:acyltransferase family protein [Myceligenerans crystallogenes]|uniref:SGNH hydrolase domain-containing protein n=1 Tax=Myceligenerans crystallogenes TaxID=316335 RepID=A0ABN2NBL9_9MICO